MDTESSEVHKMIHEGAEVYLNGELLGNGGVEYEVETPYQEAWHGEMGPSKTRPAKRTFKITMPERARALQGDWIIKRYASDGNVKEATFSGEEEARRAMRLFRDFDLEGHFELVCRPRAEDVVVTSYRNEPEEEPEFDPAYPYRDKDGDKWEFSTVEKAWVCYYHATGDIQMIRPTPPAKFGPYTRIEEEDE